MLDAPHAKSLVNGAIPIKSRVTITSASEGPSWRKYTLMAVNRNGCYEYEVSFNLDTADQELRFIGRLEDDPA